MSNTNNSQSDDDGTMDIEEEITNTTATSTTEGRENNMNNNKENLSTLEKCGSWLLSIPRDNVRLLQNTIEYNNFLIAFEKLGNAHRYQINLHQQQQITSNNVSNNACNNNNNNTSSSSIISAATEDNNEYNTDDADSNNNKKTEYNNSYLKTINNNNSYSFLQHLVVDDVIMRIFEFLECYTLIQLTTTCHRFCTLSLRSAEQRTQHFFIEPSSAYRNLSLNYYSNSNAVTNATDAATTAASTSSPSSSPSCANNNYSSFCNNNYRTTIMQLVRAKEQILGIRPNKSPYVSIPMWGLPRRMHVSQCGDVEYNGIYFCTGTNGNGFIFTKPRNFTNNNNTNSSKVFLRCIISKRFSNDNILWYMSKEMTVNENNINTITNNNTNNPVVAAANRFDLDITYNNSNITFVNQNQEKEQIFSFWAELMRSGDASSDICRYPSQTSILSRNNNNNNNNGGNNNNDHHHNLNDHHNGWQSLENTVDIHPPIVELLD